MSDVGAGIMPSNGVNILTVADLDMLHRRKNAGIKIPAVEYYNNEVGIVYIYVFIFR